jgi:dihydroflavonol-4-reductase
MRIFLTGGTGFIGGHVARKLQARGDQVVALVRNPHKGRELHEMGCEIVEGDLSDTAVIRAGLEGCEAAIHGAAIYEVGIPKGDRERMRVANVEGTRNVLGAAKEAGTPRVVYISTIGAFGNTHGEVVDESYQHPGVEFTSYYEQTKYEAHQIAKQLIADGLPCVIVQPGGVYGPKDHSMLGKQINDFVAGRLPALPFPDLGMNMVHVEDVADGVLLALDKGEIGESYVLGGEVTTMRGLIDATARVSGRKPPRFTIPTPMLKMMQPFGPVVGKVMRQPPNLREMVSSSDGVTFWATHDRAVSELGYSPRGLDEGLADTLSAEGKLPAPAAAG